MKTQVHEKQTRTKLPIQIRYRTQDYETRYLDDPRVLYVEEFREQHADDGFLAIIPREPATAVAAEGDPHSKWVTLGWAAMTLASMGWIAYRLFSLF